MTEKRALKSVEEIEQKLTDDLHVSSMILTDVKFLMSHKHYVSVKLSYSTKCILVLLIYRDVSLCKLWDFILNYEVYFNAVEENDTYRYIAVVVSYLCEDAL